MTLTRPKSLKELALEHLRECIVDGTLEMGQILSERKISEELGVSKSPVREALAQLKDEGLVSIEPQKGARVFTLSETEVAQICDFREAIEAAAFELAINRNPDGLASKMKEVVTEMTAARKSGDTKAYLAFDTLFHQLIFRYSGNDYLEASYARYVGKIAALRTHLSELPGHTDLSYKEHDELTEAVKKRNLSRIRSLLVEHLNRTREAYTKEH